MWLPVSSVWPHLPTASVWSQSSFLSSWSSKTLSKALPVLIITSQTFTALYLELCSCPVLYWITSCSFCCVLTSSRVCFLVCIWVHAPRICGRVKLLRSQKSSFWGHTSQAAINWAESPRAAGQLCSKNLPHPGLIVRLSDVAKCLKM